MDAFNYRAAQLAHSHADLNNETSCALFLLQIGERSKDIACELDGLIVRAKHLRRSGLDNYHDVLDELRRAA